MTAIHLKKAQPCDAKALALISRHAFDNDINYGAPAPGGPPGYTSDQWQSKMMRMGIYYKILKGEHIIGGIIVFLKGVGHYELGRIFLDPEFQNQGIGRLALDFLWQEFPSALKWTLDTPIWNLRNQHFYKEMGFVVVGKDNTDQVCFEKHMVRKI